MNVLFGLISNKMDNCLDFKESDITVNKLIAMLQKIKDFNDGNGDIPITLDDGGSCVDHLQGVSFNKDFCKVHLMAF